MPTTERRPSPNPAGRTPARQCKYGHDMGVHRKRRGNKPGGSYCSACKTARNRFTYRLPKHAAEMRRLLGDGLALNAASAEMVSWQRRVFEFFGRVWHGRAE